MCSRSYMNIFSGECFGTFLLVFFGCGASMASVVYNIELGFFQISMIWGASLTLAIYASRHLSCAHFNPILSVAMFVLRRIKVNTLAVYIISQLAGSCLAVLCLLLIFNNSIHAFEIQNHIVRGELSSIKTATLFVSYFQNPALPVATVSMLSAFFAEMLGTFFLIQMILLMTEDCNIGKPSPSFTPILLGCFLTILICVFAPATQASFNPARDLGARLIAFLFGWKSAAVGFDLAGILTVYILGPVVGGIAAALSFSKLMKPLMALAKV